MLLSIKNLSKHFQVSQGAFQGSRKIVRAVDELSLDIEKGDSLSLVGESGSGKTTLARMIMRLLEPTSGEIIFNGEDVTRLKQNKLDHYRRNIQMVFQDPYSSLDPRFTIRRSIKEGMTLAVGKYASEQAKEIRAQEMINAVRLEQNMMLRFPHEFSGGERQRIAIARSLALNPKMLVLDEAVSSLDVIIQQDILELLKELQQQFELTYLFISHNLRVVKQISNKIAVMYKGRIIELAETQELIDNPLHPYTKELLQAALDYKSSGRAGDFELSPRAGLVEKNKGHFVIHD